MEQISLSSMISELSIGLDAVEATLVGASPFHGKRIALLSIEIGRYLDYDEKQIFGLASCALLHDNALTEYILSEGKGIQKEINLKSHCEIGEQNISFFPFHLNVKDYILYHHECADGSGPFGLKEGEYPEEAGIIALTDQLDVRFKLSDVTPQKFERIIEYIKQNAGVKYSNRLANAALHILKPELIEQLKDDVISKSLEKKFPVIEDSLTNKEIVNLAGIVAKVIDYKSNFTKEHTMQIANKAWYMSSKVYGYEEEMSAKIYLAAALHDFGKLFIPSEILEKPGKLTDEEFEVIKSHAKYTWDCIHGIKGLEQIALWASEHHEKLNGQGYPFGKEEEDLDFISRLLACLDIYQAVREKRPYHPERTHEDTMEVLNGMAERGFIDKVIVEDLNKSLIHLEGGRASFPEVMEHVELLA